jgi:mevalonate kinase
MRVTTPTPPPGGIALSDSEKAEALADSLEAQFQPVADPSDTAVIETVDTLQTSDATFLSENMRRAHKLKKHFNWKRR